jgi:hypothetical protein
MFEFWKWGVAAETPVGRLLVMFADGRVVMSRTRDLGVGHPSMCQHSWILAFGGPWPWVRYLSTDIDFNT